MGEDVHHLAAMVPARLERKARIAALGRPVGDWRLGHLGEEAVAGAGTQEHVAIGIEHDEGVAVARRALGLFDLDRIGQRIKAPAEAAFAQRAEEAVGGARGADGGAKVHQGLGKVAGAAGDGGLHGGPDLFLGLIDRHVQGEVAGQHALDIAVDHGDALVEGDGGDGG